MALGHGKLGCGLPPVLVVIKIHTPRFEPVTIERKVCPNAIDDADALQDLRLRPSLKIYFLLSSSKRQP